MTTQTRTQRVAWPADAERNPGTAVLHSGRRSSQRGSNAQPGGRAANE
jgi:hypothetical protein